MSVHVLHLREADDPAGLHLALARFGAWRLTPATPKANWRQSLRDEARLRVLEREFVERERDGVQDLLTDLPHHPRRFMEWYEHLALSGSGQNDRLFPWLADAGMDWLVIAAALAMIQLWPHFYTVFAGILIVGNRQHALAILGHDGTHYTLSRNAAFNDFLTNLFCWWPLGLTVSGYRALHYAHHKNTGMENDA